MGLVALLLISTTALKASVVVDTASMDSVAKQKMMQRMFWKPDPIKAVWLATIFPGAGQIYNRSYWKLPIVYGGLMGCTYAVIYTNDQYIAYKEAYRELYYDIQKSTVSDDPSKAYIAILPEGYTIQLNL